MPAKTALARAARWFLDNGFVKDAQAARIRRAGKLGPELDLSGIDLRSDAADEADAMRAHEGADRQ